MMAVATEPYDVQPELQDLFLYAGKDRPELYLSPDIRRGMSTFALLADPDEVDRGTARLREDLASGRFEHVKGAYRHSCGDYLFVIAR